MRWRTRLITIAALGLAISYAVALAMPLLPAAAPVWGTAPVGRGWADDYFEWSPPDSPNQRAAWSSEWHRGMVYVVGSLRVLDAPIAEPSTGPSDSVMGTTNLFVAPTQAADAWAMWDGQSSHRFVWGFGEGYIPPVLPPPVASALREPAFRKAISDEAHDVHTFAYGWPELSVRVHVIVSTTYGAPLKAADIQSIDGGWYAPSLAQWFGARSEFLAWKPLWRGLAINWSFYSAIVGVVWFTPIGVRQWRRRHRGACVRCGYDRRGLPAATACPECGRLTSGSAAPQAAA